MPESVPDEALAHALQEMGLVTFDQLEAARSEQAAQAKKGVRLSLADALVQKEFVVPATLENVVKKVQSSAAGGIKQLGQYKLIKKIGEGGMGQVFLAEDTHVSRTVAVKVLPKKLAENHEFLRRFRREAVATGKLNHINIVCAFTVDEEQGIHYYAMEFCDGESLDELLKRTPFLPWDIATGVIMQAARGLQHAHENGIIHRDIKPANIFICRPPGAGASQPAPSTQSPFDLFGKGFVAKILDLGLSKDLGSAASSFYTQTGVAMGTPHYISPEQAKGKKQIDGRTDIYSLGATLYHLVTGETPYSGSTGAAVMMKHLTDQLPNPQDVNDEIPDGVVHIIQKMMAKEEADRYADCKELLVDLELVIDGNMPSSQAIDVAKSSIAVARKRLPKDGAAPGRKGTGKNAPVAGRRGTGKNAPVAGRRGTGKNAPVAGRRGTRRHDPVAKAAERRGGGVELATGTPSRKTLFLALGFGAGLVVVVLVGLLLFGKSGNEETAAKQEAAENEKPKQDDAGQENEPGNPEIPAPPVNDGNKPDQPDGKDGKPVTGPVPPTTKDRPDPVPPDITDKTYPRPPDTETPEPKPPPVDLSELKARQAFRAVTREAAPLLAENKFAEAIVLLDRKSREPALAKATELFKQEKADIKVVAELRKTAVETLRKKVGETVSLKKGKTPITGKVVADAKPDHVALDLGGVELSLRAQQLEAEDIDRYAPRTGDVGEDLRRRGLLYLYAGQRAKATEYFSKPETLKAEAYLRRIVVMGLDEEDVAALDAWELAEKLFAARDFKGSKAAYEAFTKQHGQTKMAEAKAADLKERLAAIDKELGLATTLTMELAPGVIMKLNRIPAGTFTMGTNRANNIGGESPAREVTITRPFYFGATELTQAQWQAVMDTKPWQSAKTPTGANYPACNLNWPDATAFCKALSAKSGRTVRLPTEAEWEYACRAGSRDEYCFGNDVSRVKDYGWVAQPRNSASGYPLKAVGLKKPNAWGLYDVHGNVYEWCSDWFDWHYRRRMEKVDPQGPQHGRERTRRGGPAADSAGHARCAQRHWGPPHDRAPGFGVRVVVECDRNQGSRVAEKTVSVDDPERRKDAIDLLPLVDPETLAHKAVWDVKEGQGLVSRPRGNGAFAIPYQPPDEYDLHMVFTPQGRTDITVHTLHGGKRFTWGLCHFDGHSAIAPVDGKDFKRSPLRLRVPQGRFNRQQRHVGTLEVRRNSVRAMLDGTVVLQWNPLSGVLGEALKQQSEKRPAIGSWLSSVAVQAVQIVEISGPGTFTRPDDPAAKEAKKKQDEVWAKRGKASVTTPQVDDVAKTMVGRWTVTNRGLKYDIEFYPNGTVKSYWDNNTGTWKKTDEKTVVVTWKGDWVITMSSSETGWTGVAKNDGSTYTFSKKEVPSSPARNPQTVTPKIDRAYFVGTWQWDEGGTIVTVKLENNGSGLLSHPNYRHTGKWVCTDNEMRITYWTKFKQVIRSVEGQWEVHKYKPNMSISDKPFRTYPVRKLEQ